jgi:hypothetical protein
MSEEIKRAESFQRKIDRECKISLPDKKSLVYFSIIFLLMLYLLNLTRPFFINKDETYENEDGDVYSEQELSVSKLIFSSIVISLILFIVIKYYFHFDI